MRENFVNINSDEKLSLSKSTGVEWAARTLDIAQNVVDSNRNW
jgi:hypothetical protein